MHAKIRTIIVDDEVKSRDVLRTLLRSFFPDQIELVGQAENVEEAYNLIAQEKPSLVFLDIQMPRANGFTLLKKYDELPFEVVFVTSFDKYAISAIKFSALDYLLKPVEVGDLKLAVKKAVDKIIQKNSSGPQVVNLLKTMDQDSREYNVAVHAGDSVKFIKQSDIIYIEADGSYCVLHTLTEHYTTSRSIKDFEDYFGENSSFVRIHRSVFLNTRHVKGYSKGEPCIIELVNGKTFEIARRKKAEVLDKLKK